MENVRDKAWNIKWCKQLSQNIQKFLKNFKKMGCIKFSILKILKLNTKILSFYILCWKNPKNIIQMPPTQTRASHESSSLMIIFNAKNIKWNLVYNFVSNKAGEGEGKNDKANIAVCTKSLWCRKHTKRDRGESQPTHSSS
jgi:hypothetical protein